MRPHLSLALLILLVGCDDDVLTKGLEPQPGEPPATCATLIEVCDGVDNDCDGDIDEGWDSDGNGVADCMDVEVCDGVDNDGDGDIDEAFDSDGDGTADCFDTEACDGLDNDGDGEVDEGFDSDGDGLGDCLDEEVCDGLDNDGDGAIDERFDADADGIADCFDTETCDGLDNDGDGEVDEGCVNEACNGVDDDGDGDIDEGFDVDGDGVARCCEPGVSVFYYSDASYETISARRSNGDGTFAPQSVFEPIDSGGEAMRMLGYGHIAGRDRALDLLWYRVSDRAKFTTTCLAGEWQTQAAGTIDRGPRSWGDLDGDGWVDYAAYDYQAGNFGSHGDSGNGFTYLGDCTGDFRLARRSWNVRFLSGLFTGGSAYNLEDFDGDGHLDMFFWAVSGGGSTPSRLWYLPGDGAGGFGAAVRLPDLNQAANYGALGDIDGDGCADWVNGSNDDGLGGSVWAVIGDCAGGVRESRMLVDQRRFASANGQSAIYGDGSSKLFDFDGDGDLDLVTSFNRRQSGGAAILHWTNDGTGHFTSAGSTDPATVLVPMFQIHSIAFLSPLP